MGTFWENKKKAYRLEKKELNPQKASKNGPNFGLDEAEQSYRRVLKYVESLKDPAVEPQIAVVRHQLGMVAEERQHFDEAEQWYRKALEIFERLRHPPLRVYTLARMGILRRTQGRPVEAMAWFVRALAIASEYNMTVLGQILGDLAVVLKAMGQETFVRAWKEQFPGQAPPMDTLREMLKRIEAGDSGS